MSISSCELIYFETFLEQAVINFVMYKFGHLSQKEWQTMYDLAKMFLHCLNHWKLETPSARKQQRQHSSNEDAAAYKINYTRLVSAKLFNSY